MSVTLAQLLAIIHRNYDFFEAHGLESKAAMRERWRAVIEDLEGGEGD
jgi:hypothetical protein